MPLMEFPLDKVVLALPKLISGLFAALEESVFSALRTADATKARWSADKLEKLNIMLNSVMFDGGGLREALRRYRDEPSRGIWSLVENKLDESAKITGMFREQLKRVDQRFAADHPELLRAMQNALRFKHSWSSEFGKRVGRPTREEIDNLDKQFDSINKEIENVQEKIKTYLVELRTTYSGKKPESLPGKSAST